jgi:hypothetical protein
VVFDPAVTGYDRLLAVFLDAHDPTAPAWSRQYASFVFAADEAQEKAAAAALAAYERERGEKVATRVVRGARFWPAEAYHQKYYLRAHRALLAEVIARVGSDADLVASTVGARVNGYVGGEGTRDEVARALDDALWPRAARERLLVLLDGVAPSPRCR